MIYFNLMIRIKLGLKKLLMEILQFRVYEPIHLEIKNKIQLLFALQNLNPNALLILISIKMNLYFSFITFQNI